MALNDYLKKLYKMYLKKNKTTENYMGNNFRFSSKGYSIFVDYDIEDDEFWIFVYRNGYCIHRKQLTDVEQLEFIENLLQK